MIRIVAKTSSTATSFVLDVDQSAQIQLNFQGQQPPDIFERKAPYSQAFTLPMTRNNNRFFESYYDVNAQVNSFDPRKSVLVEVYVDSSLVFDGILRLLNLSLTNKTYQVNVNSKEADFFTALGSATLSDLFDAQDDADYYPTDLNVQQGQNAALDITIGGTGAGHVMIPIADYGNGPDTGRVTFDSINGSGLAVANGSITGRDLKPAYKVPALINKIANSQGVNIDVGALSSVDEYANLYMLLATETKELPIRPWTGFRTGYTTTQTLPNSSAPVILPFPNDTGTGFYDPEGLWTVFGLSGFFQAPSDGTFNFSGRLLLDNSGQFNSVYQTYEFTAERSGVTVKTITFSVPPPNVISTLAQGYYVFSIWGLDMDQNEFLQLKMRRVSGTGPGPVITPSYESDETYFTLVSVNSQTTISPVQMKACMPNLTQADFIKNILMRYNYVIEQDASGDILFKPAPNVTSSSEVLDWTDKMDTESQILVDPPSTYTTRYLRFSDKQNDTWGSTYSRNTLGTELGSYVLDNEDDFTTSEKAFESVFGSYQYAPIPSVDSFNGASSVRLHPIPQLWKDKQDGTVEPTTFPPILLFRTNTNTVLSPDPIYIGGQQITSVAQFGPYTKFEPDETGVAVWWQPTWNLTTALGNEGLSPGFVQKYWNTTVQQMYNKDGRKVTASFYLTPQDVVDFDFNKAVRVANTLYRIISISNFNLSQEQLTVVTLFKLPVEVSSGVLYPSGNDECEAASSFSAPDGTVSFSNELGGGIAATEACCTEFGFNWDGTDCYWGLQRSASSTGRGSQIRPVNSPTLFDDPMDQRLFRNVNVFNSGIFPPVQQGLSWEMLDRDRRIQSSVQRLVLTATTVGALIETATVRDDEGPGIIMPTNTLVRFMIHGLGIDISGRNPVGTTTYIQQSVVAKNVGGVVSIVASTEIQQTSDTVATGRAIGAVAGTKSGETVTLDAVAIRCQGQADCTIHWVLDVQATWQDFSAFNSTDTLLLLESSPPMETEDGNHLSTEEI